MTISVDGERYRGKVDVCAGAGERFTCDFFDAFGGSVVSIAAGPDSARVVVGDQEYTVACGESLSSVPYFKRYPFTFQEIKRILTGRSPHEGLLESRPDSSWRSRRWMHARRRQGSVSAVTAARVGKAKPARIVIRETREPAWRLTLGGFRDGVAREMRLETGAENYFVVRFQRVRVGGVDCDESRATSGRR